MLTTAARDEDFSYRVWRYDGAPGELIPLLQSAQDHFGYIPRRAISYISGVTGVGLPPLLEAIWRELVAAREAEAADALLASQDDAFPGE